ncbi:hypothetical protein SAMN05216330_1011314 [Bradyrhizobium sp. Ghvi]|nr:hypothetical protein SAMN05216330_1011314 [Bradyrhizobium sp. Ghvi]
MAAPLSRYSRSQRLLNRRWIILESAGSLTEPAESPEIIEIEGSRGGRETGLPFRLTNDFIW